MAQVDKQYHQLANAIIDYGYEYTTENRPNVKCKQLTSALLQLPLTEFPLITTKEMFIKGIVGELLWFLRGDTNIKYLVDNNINIWNKDAYNYSIEDKNEQSLEDFIKGVKSGGMLGNLGRIYGAQWRDWTKVYMYADVGQIESFDQITQLIENLRKPNPISRRHIVTAWNPAELDRTALPPCHWAFEILPRPLNTSDKIHYSGGDMEYLDALWNSAYIKNDMEAKEILMKELAHIPDYGFTLKWHQRSVDTFLGLPFNIASYGLLAMIIGRMVKMKPLELIGDLSNVHFYEPHIPIVMEQLKNNPNTYTGCGFEITFEGEKKFEIFDEDGNINNLFQSLDIEDFVFPGYESFPQLKGEMYEEEK